MANNEVLVGKSDIDYMCVGFRDMRFLMTVSTAAIEAIIRDEIRSAQADRPTPKAGWEPQVDSLVMVSIALRIEEEFNVKLPEAAMPPGGFDDENMCVADFTQRVAKLLEEQQRKSSRKESKCHDR